MLVGLGAIVLLGFAVLVYLLASILIDRRLIAFMEHVAHTERARAHWAEARRELLSLVANGKLRIDSETFRTFYGLQTYIMRRPDAYAAFSSRLAAVVIRKPSHKAGKSWQAEVQEWPIEMEPILAHMSTGVMALVMGYPTGRRLMLRFAVSTMAKLAPVVARHASSALTRRLADAAKAVPGVRATHRLLAAQSRLETIRGRLRDHAFA